MSTDKLKHTLAHPSVTTALGWATALVTLSFLVLAVLYWPRITTDTSQSLLASQVQGCRSASAANVTDARTEFDVARAARDTEATHLDLLIAQALVDVGERDRDGLEAALDDIVAAQALVRSAEREVVQATSLLRAAQDLHQSRTTMSIEEPERFLTVCKTFVKEP